MNRIQEIQEELLKMNCDNFRNLNKKIIEKMEEIEKEIKGYNMKLPITYLSYEISRIQYIKNLSNLNGQTEEIRLFRSAKNSTENEVLIFVLNKDFNDFYKFKELVK